MFRQQVVRADGQVVDLLQRRAHLSYCFNACCCGRVDRGFPAVPTEAFTNEWLRRGLRKVVHLTKGGCLGPCTLANVASLLIDGRSIWFHSVNSAREVTLIFDYIESLITSAQFLPAPPELAEHIFNFYDWDARGEPPCGVADSRAPR